LVNTSRGAIIEENALIDALRSNRIGHAALDVFEVEPLLPGHPLTLLANVTLTAHAGFKTPEASQRLLMRGFALLRQDLDILASKTLLTIQ
jgi:D-3-phosphoglycerate dehydrogenase / 2-oxoglutarate reductase